MRLRHLLTSAVALAATSAALVALPTTSALAAADSPPAVDPAVSAEVGKGKTVRVIVEVDEGKAVAPVAKEAEKLSSGTDVLPTEGAKDFFVMEVDKATLGKLDDNRSIASIQKDRLKAPSLDVSTKVIGADKAHQAGVTGAGQNVVIVDTGIDRDHPFFAGRIVTEACFSTTYADFNSSSLCPDGSDAQTGQGAADAETAKCLSGGENLCDHGTHVAGIAAGKKSAGAPADGVAPGAGIIAIQVFSRFDGSTCTELGQQSPCVLSYESDQKRGLAYAAQLTASHKIAAVNMSIGGGLFLEACDDDPDGNAAKPEIDALLAKGVPTVIASGNNGRSAAVSSPACISSAIAVGATDDSDAIAPFSNRGVLLDLLAPGVQINSSVPDDTWGQMSGTSMAAPHVAGAFALLREKSPNAGVAELLKKLQDTGKAVKYLSGDANVTTKRINVFAALPPATTPTPTPTPTVTPTATPTSSATPTASQPAGTPTPTATPSPSPTHTQPGGGDLDPLPVPDVCERGHGRKALSAAGWAKEMHKKTGTLPDQTLLCYLSLAQNGSKVFAEVRNAGSLGKAYTVLKGKSGKAALDRELLAAWLNWAHGVYNGSTKVKGATTLKSAVSAAEKHRLNPKATSAQVRRAAAYLNKNVNRAK